MQILFLPFYLYININMPYYLDIDDKHELRSISYVAFGHFYFLYFIIFLILFSHLYFSYF